MQGLEELYRQCTTPLYMGSKCSVVSATIVIMNMCVVFGVSNNFASELLQYLSEDLLPEGNKLPRSQFAAAKTIRKLGMNYNNIHACPDGCVLYEGDISELNVCPKCSKSRWMEGTNTVPSKVIRHFPLIPRLKRMWRSPEIASMLTGYTKHVSEDGMMRSVVDNPAWKHVDNDVAFDNFGMERRNMRLALALDGVNPFKLSNTNWSTWPLLILIYNLEPWFVTKKFFISLCILISEKRSPNDANIDVFLRPLLDELQQLWHGVPTLDFSQPPGSRRFNMRGLLMWTIFDFPAYGLISGLCCKGYKGCPCCGPDTDGRSAKTGDLRPDCSTKGSKIVFGGIRRYLARHHPYHQTVEDILELDYRNHCTTVLLCEWVKLTRDGRVPNIERDRYGFTVANFNHMDSRVQSDSFAFPLHCQQVFLSDDPSRRGWKIVLRTDVRGRRLPIHHAQPAATVIAVGNGDDFQGLQPTIQETEPLRRPAPLAGITLLRQQTQRHKTLVKRNDK